MADRGNGGKKDAAQTAKTLPVAVAKSKTTKSRERTDTASASGSGSTSTSGVGKTAKPSGSGNNSVGESRGSEVNNNNNTSRPRGENNNNAAHAQTAASVGAGKPTWRDEIAGLKKQIGDLVTSVATLAPVVKEMKSAFDTVNTDYDDYVSDNDGFDDSGDVSDNDRAVNDNVNDHVDHDVSGSDNDEDRPLGLDSDHEDGELSDAEAPPKKKRCVEGSLLERLSRRVKSKEKLGEEIHPELAELVAEMLRKGMPDEAIDEMIKQNCRPKNCEAMEVVQVNPEIWDSVRQETRSLDLKMQRIQKLLMKGLVPIIEMADASRKAAEDGAEMPSPEQYFNKLTDGINMIAAANHNINMRRKDIFRPSVQDRYKSLCSSKNPVGKLLFGDDLSKTVRDLSETTKVTQQLTKSTPTRNGSNFRGRGRGRGGRGGRIFLGHAPTPWNQGNRGSHHGYRKRGGNYNNNNNNNGQKQTWTQPRGQTQSNQKK